MIKRIDYLVLRSFFPPLIVWFLVALFIFNMQFLWKYIDEIVGKGLEVMVILELLFYQAVAMVPKALVFGILIASVMTMGNLGEHYELASLKSAGVSLFRTMRPMLVCCILMAVSSYTFSDYIIPNAALQFKSRLHDIRKKKPALNLERGQFNYDFKNIVIYIGDKDADSRHLWNIKLYDHTKGMGNVSQTNARKGELFYSDDKRYLILRLYDGVRYETMQAPSNRPNSSPALQVAFKEFTAMFDMKQFEMKNTDKDLFKDHYSLLASHQLLKAVDSVQERKERRIGDYRNGLKSSFHFQRISTDTIIENIHFVPNEEVLQTALAAYKQPLPDEYIKTIDENKRISMARRAFGAATQIKNQTETSIKVLEGYDSSIAAHENEIYQKIVYALACIMFLFVGAPLGALIRKGGFGWPILVSFVCFMIFFVANLLGERLAKNLITPCWFGSWLPILVITPMAVWLSVNAARDTEAFAAFERIKMFFLRLRDLFPKRQKK